MKVRLGKTFAKQMGMADNEIEDKAPKGITIEDLQKSWKARDRWRRQHFVQAFFINIWEVIKWRIPQKLEDAKYEVIYAWQRAFRGYDDVMVFSYWSENARLNIKILKELKKIKHGYPIILLNKKEEARWKLSWKKHDKELSKRDQARWVDYMKKMIAGWQAILDEDNVHITKRGKYDRRASDILRAKHRKIWEEGMILYTQHYRGLWD